MRANSTSFSGSSRLSFKLAVSFDNLSVAEAVVVVLREGSSSFSVTDFSSLIFSLA